MSSGIAGFGFSTIQKRDLSDLDQILSRIEDLGASHAELSLGGADLVCGGRILTAPRGAGLACRYLAPASWTSGSPAPSAPPAGKCSWSARPSLLGHQMRRPRS